MFLVKRFIPVLATLAIFVTPVFATATAAAATPHNGAYVALGDSVAAGDGLPQSANPSSTDIACGLSPQAYAGVVASALKMPYVNAACSGASLSNLSVAQKVNGITVRPQLDTAFSYGVPSLISITAGANDAHWQQLITSCFISTCGTAAQTKLASSYLVHVQAQMRSELQQINTRSHGNPPLTLVTAYYDPLSANCSKTISTITPAEVSWIASEVTALNQTIKNSTVGFTFAKYVPVTFQGHSMCDANSWVQTFADLAPFHPNATGQYGLGFVVVVARNQAISAGIK